MSDRVATALRYCGSSVLRHDPSASLRAAAADGHNSSNRHGRCLPLENGRSSSVWLRPMRFRFVSVAKRPGEVPELRTVNDALWQAANARLEPLIGTRTRVAEVLNRKRSLSRMLRQSLAGAYRSAQRP